MQYNIKFQIHPDDAQRTDAEGFFEHKVKTAAYELGLGILDKVGLEKKDKDGNTEYDCTVVAYPVREWLLFQQTLRSQITENFNPADVPQLLTMFGAMFEGLEKGVFKIKPEPKESKLIVEP